MQVQDEQSQEKIIQELQRKVDELTADNLLLRDQLARKEQFTAMIAHELRGPLSPIINYAQLLARHTCAPQRGETEGTPRRSEVIQRQTNVIVSQARRLARLVDDLRDASSLASGRFTLVREPCDIVALAQETVEHLRPVAPYHTLTVEAPDAPVIGHWDSGRLQQVIGNLLDNAAKYSDEHTTITLRIWATLDIVHVSVHNQGASIPTADIGQLFRPYARLQGTSGARQGSGLGLYITKSIIEAHGGSLRLESNAESGEAEGKKGTTFLFDLPLRTPSDAR